MRFFLFFFPFLFSFLYASLNYAVSNIHSFVLPKNSFELKGAYLKVDDKLDIFNLKDKKYNKFGSIGDMDGGRVEFRGGISDKDSLFITFDKWNIDYGDSILQNKKFSFFSRYQFKYSEIDIFNFYSFDIGFENNKGNSIIISDDKYLNTLVKRVKPDSNLKFNNGTMIIGDTTLTFYDDNHHKIYPHISIGHLESNSYFFRFLAGKKFKNSFLDLYTGFGYTNIKTKIAFYPNNFFTKDIVEKYREDLRRNERFLKLGFSYMLKIKKFIGEFNYEYTKLFRDKSVAYLDESNTLKASISRIITKKFLIYVGGKIMFEQFNSDIPYLYNKYTKTQFDHKYGFAEIGFLYKYKGF